MDRIRPRTGHERRLRAARDLARRTRETVFHTDVKPRWLEGGAAFWYRVRTGPGKHQFVLVDAEKGRRAPAFDHVKLAEALNAATGRSLSPDALPIDRLAYNTDRTEMTFTLDDQAWRWVPADSKLEKTTAPEVKAIEPRRAVGRASVRTGEETEVTFVNRAGEPVELFWLDNEGEKRSYGTIEPGREHRQHTFAGHVWMAVDRSGRERLRIEAESEPGRVVIDGTPQPDPPRDRPAHRRRSGGATSPDGRWTASIEDNNVHVRDTKSNEHFTLSSDGTAEDPYRGEFFWSPDSRKLVVMRVKPEQEHKVSFVESSPRDQVQPKLHTINYLKPGDQIAHPRPRLFDLETRKPVAIAEDLFPNPWSIEDVRWSVDSRRFTFLYNQRGHQVAAAHRRRCGRRLCFGAH